jgi:hypothetical protein
MYFLPAAASHLVLFLSGGGSILNIFKIMDRMNWLVDFLFYIHNQKPTPRILADGCLLWVQRRQSFNSMLSLHPPTPGILQSTENN